MSVHCLCARWVFAVRSSSGVGALLRCLSKPSSVSKHRCRDPLHRTLCWHLHSIASDGVRIAPLTLPSTSEAPSYLIAAGSKTPQSREEAHPACCQAVQQHFHPSVLAGCVHVVLERTAPSSCHSSVQRSLALDLYKQHLASCQLFGSVCSVPSGPVQPEPQLLLESRLENLHLANPHATFPCASIGNQTAWLGLCKLRVLYFVSTYRLCCGNFRSISHKD